MFQPFTTPRAALESPWSPGVVCFTRALTVNLNSFFQPKSFRGNIQLYPLALLSSNSPILQALALETPTVLGTVGEPPKCNNLTRIHIDPISATGYTECAPIVPATYRFAPSGPNTMIRVHQPNIIPEPYTLLG